jgi:hypothetical protein
MKKQFAIRWPAMALAMALFMAGCGPDTEKMSSNDDVKKFVDFTPASRRLIGLKPALIQQEIGSPDDIRHHDNGDVLWIYDHRFCDADTRCVYKKVTLLFENQRLKTVEPN